LTDEYHNGVLIAW